MITCIEDQLARDESNRAFAYDDADGSQLTQGRALRGNLTIGIGRNLSACGVSLDERALMLQNDLRNANALLESKLPWTSNLDPVRKGALLNMAFNMESRLLGFKNFLALLQSGDYNGAAAAMLDSAWANQVGARAQRLAIQIREGTWQ